MGIRRNSADGRPMRRFRRTNEAQPNPTSIISFEPRTTNRRARHLHLLTCLLITNGSRIGRSFVSECWLGRRLYSARIYVCIEQRARSIDFAFFAFHFPMSGSVSSGGLIDGGRAKAPTGMEYCFLVLCVLSCCFELTINQSTPFRRFIVHHMSSSSCRDVCHKYTNIEMLVSHVLKVRHMPATTGTPHTPHLHMPPSSQATVQNKVSDLSLSGDFPGQTGRRGLDPHPSYASIKA